MNVLVVKLYKTVKNKTKARLQLFPGPTFKQLQNQMLLEQSTKRIRQISGKLHEIKANKWGLVGLFVNTLTRADRARRSLEISVRFEDGPVLIFQDDG